MPTLVHCPTCKGPLRVADDLVGRPVRCPACQAVFEAAAPAAQAPDHPARADEPADTPGLKGAVEIKLALDEPAAPVPAPAPPPEREERRPPPRLADEHDDLLECPACGRSNHRDARRCSRCGELLAGYDPDEGRGRPARREPLRRDAEPHRGTMILVLGILSLVMTFLLCGPVGVVLGLMAWVMGHSDLRKIRARQMDPEGEGSTQAGWVCGIIGTLLNTLATLACLGFMALMINETYNSAPTTRPRFGTPAQPKRPVGPGPVRKF